MDFIFGSDGPRDIFSKAVQTWFVFARNVFRCPVDIKFTLKLGDLRCSMDGDIMLFNGCLKKSMYSIH